jgi:hypothetical protein
MTVKVNEDHLLRAPLSFSRPAVPEEEREREGRGKGGREGGREIAPESPVIPPRSRLQYHSPSFTPTWVSRLSTRQAGQSPQSRARRKTDTETKQNEMN